MEEKYFVGSFGDFPEKIMFSPIDAFVSGFTYIDSFDECGNKFKAYQFIDDEYIIIADYSI